MFTEQHEDQSPAKQTKSIGKHTGDGSCAVPELKRFAITAFCSCCDTKVSLRSKAHTDKSDKETKDGTYKERPWTSPTESVDRSCVREIKEQSDKNDQWTDLLKLRCEVGIWTFTDSSSNFLHFLCALVGFAHLLYEHKRIEQTGNGDAENR